MTRWLRRYGWPLLAVWAAFVLRLHRLAEPLMRWDEGWSVAHASLAWGDVVRVASWEVHPPLFYLLLKPWLALGADVFVVRFLPVLVGTLAVPLVYRVARRWVRGRRVAWLAAGLTAVAPALVYYAQVVRMYPWVVVWLLLATWALLRWLDGEGTGALVAFGLGGLAALYTFYYTAFALAGLYAYGLWMGRRRRMLLLTGAATGALYLPWVALAGRGMWERALAAAPAETIMPVTAWDLARSTWTALTFDFASGGWAAALVLALLVVPWLLRRPDCAALRPLLLPGLVLLSTVGGIVAASGAYFFAPRLLTPAVPFLLLALARSLDGLARRGRWLLLGAACALVVAFWPTSASFVYEKGLEVSGDFDPHKYHAFLGQHAAGEDYVFFNSLALAGWYEMDRGPEDPAWGHALRWTPIVEPLAQVQPRVLRAAERYPRLWFVLYKGTFGPGEAFKAWLDGTLYPAGLDWRGGDSMFLSYLPPHTALQPGPGDVDFGGQIALERSRYSATVGPGGEVLVDLRWRALEAPLPDYRVVVQVWDETGQVLAQRDVQPANWDHPTGRWRPGEAVVDRHGLRLSARSETPLHLAVSWYDTESGAPLLIEGEPFLELGVLAGW
jgi:hypothetical protein